MVLLVVVSALCSSAPVSRDAGEYRERFMEARGDLMNHEVDVAERELSRELLAEDAKLQMKQHAVVRAVEEHGYRIPSWAEGVTRLLQGSVPDAEIMNLTNQCQTATAANHTGTQKTFGVLDIASNGSLVLMQSVPPFETRRDLTLSRNVGCPKLRSRIHSVFMAGGTDMDVLVVGADRSDDCVVAITQEIEDKK
jgi:hypothetical protein